MSRLSCWGVTPMRARASLDSRGSSYPSTRISPSSATACAVSMRMVVDFPAPLGPSRPKQIPSGTSRSRPSTATMSPKDLRTPRSRMAGSVATPPVWRSCSLSRNRHVGQALERRLHVRLGELRVLETPRQVGVVGGEVEVAVAAQATRDHPLLARLLGRLRLVEHGRDRVGGLGRRDDPLGAGEAHRGIEGLVLLVRPGL